MHELPIFRTNNTYSLILHVLSMTIKVMHFNHKYHHQLQKKPSTYLKTNTYFLNSWCIKYDSLNYACHKRINTIYG